MKEPVRLRAESLLEVESQRSRGSDSSGKKPLATPPPPLLAGEGRGGRCLWAGLWLMFTDDGISWFASN